ncbi:hypothetical protein GSI_10223 [Ganoderma sinense ZZ0214-1]|uniref:Glycosyl hydrolase family 95 catalytic domain-containing protein n=1 Tax=Ganoderma sinense ZZ0214-1 TaxID=1077348 RepID=A0A2G8S020_9APHY|nr:hypothetical protein GSI_10223 [Ganoderma sinense ZZ0214-1]
MAFEILARVSASGTNTSVPCAPADTNNATISVRGASATWITWVGDTNYDANAGDAAHAFSFKGATPTTRSSRESLVGKFRLGLGQKPDLDGPTGQLRDAYQTDVGDTYLEWLLFNFGRYLLASSARGTLPANLQGKWGKDASNPWGADYHANINLQMNYWFAELTDMDVVKPLFDYIEKTWAPRGSFTAQYLYNISQGWVTHDEMNIFGHTGMKQGGGTTSAAADYPEANAWMVVPTHSRSSGSYSTPSPRDFLNKVRTKRAQMDKGIHIGSWGQLQEWKVDMDSPSDTHRHLSHLVGLYLGYAITGYDPAVQQTRENYTHKEAIATVTNSLIHRGNGTGPDADSWGQLANASVFYRKLSYALERSFAPNLFSLYSAGPGAIFQIDANFGFAAALLNDLIQVPDVASTSDVYNFFILPALPAS